MLSVLPTRQTVCHDHSLQVNFLHWKRFYTTGYALATIRTTENIKLKISDLFHAPTFDVSLVSVREVAEANNCVKTFLPDGGYITKPQYLQEPRTFMPEVYAVDGHYRL